ncbi:GOLPH3/VPS74 family protein [Cerasicoccus fimbriatus]|uniref:GOLPH3/VPS74 family protein n=1 Tax=Cerasicoccus fimbriatus TaxID=3014554 RepID=UPI0022B46776|nr:GPP34 family phosphoprotein [Cerasicoccus sp. TK19100]
MLRFAEEITLLALNDETGVMHRNVPRRAFDYAIAGALMMELAFLNQLDTDADNVIMLDTKPTNDPLLDEALLIVSGLGAQPSIVATIEALAAKAEHFEPRIFAGLVHKGILEEREKRFLWMKGERTYPMINGKEETEVRTRIRMTILAEDVIPDPKDVVIIALMEATKLYRVIFIGDELRHCRKKIHQFAKMDFIGQGIAEALAKAADIREED